MLRTGIKTMSDPNFLYVYVYVYVYVQHIFHETTDS